MSFMHKFAAETEVLDVGAIVYASARHRRLTTGIDYLPLVERYRGDVRSTPASQLINELEKAFEDYERPFFDRRYYWDGTEATLNG